MKYLTQQTQHIKDTEPEEVAPEELNTMVKIIDHDKMVEEIV